MKINESQLKKIIKETIETILNESSNNYYEKNLYGYFTLDDFDDYLLKNTSDEEKKELVKKYARPGDDEEDSIYWASIDVPEELDLCGKRNGQISINFTEDLTPSKYSIEYANKIFSKIPDKIVQKYVKGKFMEWLDSITYKNLEVKYEYIEPWDD
jgi:hypothetical protein